MPTRTFDFANRRGRSLSGRLEVPEGPVRAWAVFAHCFTCDKRSLAAVRVSRALAERGVGVLRFDFTGLGESEGELAESGFSANVDDLLDAVARMRAQGCAPALLVGHSLGGAAVLAAAGEVPEARAVAVIGAPCQPEHVLRLMVGAPDAEGRVALDVGGRQVTLDPAFVEDLKRQDPARRIAALDRALLVLHAPGDAVVGIDNASAIFAAARHPKSFVSLDGADHLLSAAADADYAAGVIAAWADRYLPATDPAPEDDEPERVTAEETGAGRFQTRITTGGRSFVADEPEAVGGLGSGPSPYALLSAALGACTVMTVRLYAERKGWPLERARAVVRHERRSGAEPADLFEREVGFSGPLDDAQRARLLEIAGRCPVHRTLERGARVETRAEVPPGAAAAATEQHFHEMERACREPDR